MLAPHARASPREFLAVARRRRGEGGAANFVSGSFVGLPRARDRIFGAVSSEGRRRAGRLAASTARGTRRASSFSRRVVRAGVSRGGKGIIRPRIARAAGADVIPLTWARRSDPARVFNATSATARQVPMLDLVRTGIVNTASCRRDPGRGGGAGCASATGDAAPMLDLPTSRLYGVRMWGDASSMCYMGPTRRWRLHGRAPRGQLVLEGLRGARDAGMRAVLLPTPGSAARITATSYRRRARAGAKPAPPSYATSRRARARRAERRRPRLP